MSISILNRGASGGLKPELTVTAPAGSTIDLLRGSIIVDTYTLGVDETKHTFIASVGTYTVHGTFGTDTTDVDVAIDTVGQYEVTLTYRLYLYNLGDECEDVTGGWSQGGGVNGTGSITKNADSLKVYASNTNASRSAMTNNTIDVTGYSKVCMVADISTNNEKYCMGRWGITPGRSWAWDGSFPSGTIAGSGLYGYGAASGSVKQGQNVLLELNIDTDGSYYALVIPATGINTTLTVVLRQFWIER